MRHKRETSQSFMNFFKYNLQMIPTKLRNTNFQQFQKVGWTNLKGYTT
jgi:hypothetical protein